jgi:hypothetical protein
MLKFFILICIARNICGKIHLDENEVKELQIKVLDLKEQVNNKTLNVSPKLADIIEHIPSAELSRQESSAVQFYVCNICLNVIDEFMFIRRIELLNDTYLIEMAVDLCSLFEIQSAKICRGIVEFYAPTVIYIVDKRPDLSADTACKFLLNDGDCKNPSGDSSLALSINIDENRRNSSDENETTESQIDDDDLIIVQVTDIHVDFKYKQGALADCSEFACCRDTSNKVDDAEKLAGYYGDYRYCDTPWIAVEDALYQITKQHPVSFIIFSFFRLPHDATSQFIDMLSFISFLSSIALSCDVEN